MAEEATQPSAPDVAPVEATDGEQIEAPATPMPESPPPAANNEAEEMQGSADGSASPASPAPAAADELVPGTIALDATDASPTSDGAATPLEATEAPSPTGSPTTPSPTKKKKKAAPPPAPISSGLSPAMRKLVRRGLATTPGTDEAPRRRERSQEELESNAAKQAMKRRVAELWSKQPHGYTGHDLNFILLNLSSCNLSDEDGIALASELSSTERRPLRVVDLRGNRFQDTALTASLARLRAAARLARPSSPLSIMHARTSVSRR